MSMDLRVLFQRQSKTAKEGKDKKTAVVLEDDEDDFRRASVDSGSGTKRGKTEVGETKRKRRRKRIMDSDSEDEAPKKKVKATPPRLGSKVKSHSAVAGKSKVISPTAVRGRSKVKSSLAVGVKKEVKSATDFFGSAPVKRSPYFKSSSDEKRKDEEVVRVSESPTEPPDNHHSSVSQSEGPSQPSYTATPTKRLSIEVTRIATPPKMSSPRPQSRDGGDGHGEREGGKEKEGVRRSPRKKTKRGRLREEETEEARESETTSSKSDCDVCGKKICKCAQKTKKVKSETSEKSIEERKERAVRTKPPKARKVIKYLDDSEEEERDKKEDFSKAKKRGKSSVKKDKDEEKERGEKRREKDTVDPPKSFKKRHDSGDESVGKGGGGGGDVKKREQAVLTTSVSSSTLACISPRKPGASPRRQGTPEREDYLVKQPGLTFDKDKSASPVKTPKKKIEDTRHENVVVPTLTKQVSTPVKPVSKTSPVKQVSTPVQLVSRPQAPPTKTTTPSSGPRPGGGTTPGTTPKVYRGSSYRSYMNRSGPKAPGSKVVPKGEENCFDGLTFIITGVLESLEREEAADIVKRYGGKVTTSLSRRTSYLVVGEEAGESKLAKAAQLGTKRIDEDGLLELLRTRPGKKAAGGRCSVKRLATTSRKSSSSSSPPGARRSTRGAKFGSKSPPSATVRGDNIIATPNRKHVTTTVAMATPSPGGANSSTETPKPQKNGDLMWVDKYRPRCLKNVIGQQGDKSSARKLLRWLMDWEKNRSKVKGGAGGGKKGWGGASQGDGAGLRAALLSGPPGVGKTTTAVLACEEAGYSYVELNASATRSKRTLHEDVAVHLDCTSLDAFRTTSSSGGKVGVASGRRHALIMDEVDGMAGNEDRGGMQEVISMIKMTKVPIICICNDRQHPKIRSLSNHCFDLRFPRPKVDQIRGAMMSICYKEGVKMAPNALAEVIMASGQDIRQVLHNLSVWTATDKNMDYDKAKETAKSAKKESKLNPFDVIKLVFMPVDGSRELSLAERSDLFFHDYSLAPLFVQENYPSVRPLQAKGDVKQTLRLLAETADCVSDGDIVERMIRSASQWGLLPVQAIFSSVLPGQLMRGGMGRPEFPRWLGNHSARGKNDRLLQELQRHTRLRTSCNKTEFGLDYLPVLHSRLTQPLLSQGGDGVPGVVAMMTTYDLVREDWDSIVELNQFSGRPNKISELPSKVKAAFTRTFNKEHHKTHYGIRDAKKSRVALTTDYHDNDNEEEGPDSEPESDSYSDRMLKTKETSTASASSSRATKREGGGGGGKGKGVAGKNHQKKGKTKK